MNEQEENAFRAVYQFYAKWRDIIIETDEQWEQFSADVGKLCRENGDNYVGPHLITAVLNAFNDMYLHGTKPTPAGYFGRDDLST